jgi:DNA-repair protein XRCC2
VKEPPGSTFIENLDRAINQALPFSTSDESSLNRGDLIEIQGPSGSGKTELLYFIAMTTIFPQDFKISPLHLTHSGEKPKVIPLGGRGASVIVCDCDGRWSMTRLYHIMETLLRQRLQETYPGLDPNIPEITSELKALILQCMGHLHLFQPLSIISLTATLLNLQRYHFTNMEDEELCMLMVDGGLSPFYWQDRWVSESLGVNNKEYIPSTTSGFVKALQGIRESHNPIVFITNWAISPLSNTPFFRQHLPPPYPAVSDNHLERSQVSRVSPIQITHHITLCDPHQSPLSDHEELPEGPPNPANQNSRDTPLTIQGIMRTPPRDLPDQVVTHFSFLLAECGVTVMPNREQEDVMPIEELTSRSAEQGETEFPF